MAMHIQKNVDLKKYSSFHSGGKAQELIECTSADDTVEALAAFSEKPITNLGFGTNVLISDSGIDGVTLLHHHGDIQITDGLVVAEAGVWWDDLVTRALDAKLWGVELMSGIPSSVGGAIMGNIAAYGQQISDTLDWVDIITTQSQKIERVPARDLSYGYRYCSLQARRDITILRAAFKLSAKPTQDLEYSSALRIADEYDLDTHKLVDRRQIILEARKRAGSLYDPKIKKNAYTAGSFFKNPTVSSDIAQHVMTFDESGKTAEALMQQNKIHGGDSFRVSAAHVLLAAGFKRGQTWGNVRLHPEHILKIENHGNASSQEIYNVAQNLMSTVKDKLNIVLEPEVQFIGVFT